METTKEIQGLQVNFRTLFSYPERAGNQDQSSVFRNYGGDILSLILESNLRFDQPTPLTGEDHAFYAQIETTGLYRVNNYSIIISLTQNRGTYMREIRFEDHLEGVRIWDTHQIQEQIDFTLENGKSAPGMRAFCSFNLHEGQIGGDITRQPQISSAVFREVLIGKSNYDFVIFRNHDLPGVHIMSGRDPDYKVTPASTEFAQLLDRELAHPFFARDKSLDDFLYRYIQRDYS